VPGAALPPRALSGLAGRYAGTGVNVKAQLATIRKAGSSWRWEVTLMCSTAPDMRDGVSRREYNILEYTF
jgi:hypothetical protein